jgi:uncharacterized membrane protein YgcG
MRAIKVTYSNGDTVTTSMAAHLTDEEMTDYFKVGKWFNIGSVYDNMQQVVKAKILK